MRTIIRWKTKLFQGLSFKNILWIVAGAAICTFGIHNIHQQVGITEGGVIGGMLLLEHWLGSPRLTSPRCWTLPAIYWL